MSARLATESPETTEAACLDSVDFVARAGGT